MTSHNGLCNSSDIFKEVKRQASKKWNTIIPALCHNISPDDLTIRNKPCPLCGGKDRFAAFSDFDETGGVICRKCHDKDNGDGISTVAWLNGEDQIDAAKRIASHLGIDDNAIELPELDIIDQVCRAKGIKREYFEKFGVIIAERNGEPVARVDMFDGEGKVCSYFDTGMGVKDAKLKKGKVAYQKPAGIFLPQIPKAGER